MGDVIHTLPAVHALRRGISKRARIGWLIEERWAELLCAPGISAAGMRGLRCGRWSMKFIAVST
jgi:hypothetical protein